MKKLLLLFCSFAAFAQTPFSPNANVTGLRFGYSCAISGTDVVVATSAYNFPPNPMSGQVVAFEYTNGNIVQEAVLSVDDNILIGDQYGRSISVNDGNLAIGAPLHDGDGAVYLFQKTNGNWNYLQKLTLASGVDGDAFGTVTVHGDFLFVGAPLDQPQGAASELENGSVSVYHFNGTQWDFLTELEISGSFHFGESISAENNLVVITSSSESQSRIFHTYHLNGTDLVFDGSSPEFGDLEHRLGGYTLSGGKIYMPQRTLEGNSEILILDVNAGQWTPTSGIPVFTDDYFYGPIVVQGDQLLLGAESYILQFQRKFPVRYYQKINETWTYQSSLYGIGPEGTDDYFGQVLASDGSSVIIGAPREGIVLSYGKAYYLDMNSLSTPEFDRASISLFPNPTNGIVNIGNPDGLTLDKLEIFGVTGALLYTEKTPSNIFDMSNLASGLYLVSITLTDGTRKTQRLAKR